MLCACNGKLFWNRSCNVDTVLSRLIKGTASRESMSSKHLGSALDLKYEPMNFCTLHPTLVSRFFISSRFCSDGTSAKRPLLRGQKELKNKTCFTVPVAGPAPQKQFYSGPGQRVGLLFSLKKTKAWHISALKGTHHQSSILWLAMYIIIFSQLSSTVSYLCRVR
jgi:hypothetical protein